GELQISGWVLPADPSVTGLYSCKGSNNMTGFCDTAMDEAMIASDQELDPAKRKAFLFKAQELLAENAFSLPIYYNVNTIVTSKKLGNFKASGTNLGSFWNVFEWYLNKKRALMGELPVRSGSSPHGDRMGRYVRLRLIQMVPLLFGISLLIFLIIQAAPGGPEAVFLANRLFIDPSVIDAFCQRLGL